MLEYTITFGALYMYVCDLVQLISSLIISSTKKLNLYGVEVQNQIMTLDIYVINMLS